AGGPCWRVRGHSAVVVVARPGQRPWHDAGAAERYAALDPDLPPHVFGVAAMAYKELCDAGRPQVLVAMGREGSGKACACGQAVSFLAAVASPEEHLEKRLRALWPLLEPFLAVQHEPGRPPGGVSGPPLPAAPASTRAALSVEFGFDGDQFIVKNRVCVECLEVEWLGAASGRSFDVLHQLLAARRAGEWLAAGPRAALERLQACARPTDADGLQRTLEAMEAFGLEPAPVLRALSAAVLLLGLLAAPAAAAELPSVAAALGVSAARLAAALSGAPSRAAWQPDAGALRAFSEGDENPHGAENPIFQPTPVEMPTNHLQIEGVRIPVELMLPEAFRSMGGQILSGRAPRGNLVRQLGRGGERRK
ncbi:unnamed protein product, partial [Prorocentrum cordatum]